MHNLVFFTTVSTCNICNKDTKIKFYCILYKLPTENITLIKLAAI